MVEYHNAMKTIGIIGGLGPETSSKFYLEIIFKAYKLNSNARPPIIMWSVPIEYQTESDFINGEDRSAKYSSLLIDAGKEAIVILLACTDLQLLTPSFLGVTIFDTMEILVDATVERCR